jgi:hypothetical protein
VQWLSLNNLLRLLPPHLNFKTQNRRTYKMSQTIASKTSKVAAAHDLVVEHMKSLPEKDKCEDEDFVVWGHKFLELKVRC